MNRFLPLLFFCAVIGMATAKPLVISSNTLLHDMVRTIGAEAIDESSLIPIGVDPHGFQPKPSDVRLIGRAQLIVVNGLGLETWLQKMVENSGFRGAIIVASRGIEPLLRDEDDSPVHRAAAEVDPHAWFDLQNARRYVENIRDGLAAVDPAHTELFVRNAAHYLTQIDELHQWALTEFSTLPPTHKKLVTSHDTFAYLARAYGLTILPIAGLQPDQEPSAKQLARTIDFVREQKVRAVFFENTINPQTVRLIADEAGVSTVTELYTDSLGPVGSPGDTFLGLVRFDILSIVNSLK